MFNIHLFLFSCSLVLIYMFCEYIQNLSCLHPMLHKIITCKWLKFHHLHTYYSLFSAYLRIILTSSKHHGERVNYQLWFMFVYPARVSPPCLRLRSESDACVRAKIHPRVSVQFLQRTSTAFLIIKFLKIFLHLNIAILVIKGFF